MATLAQALAKSAKAQELKVGFDKAKADRDRYAQMRDVAAAKAQGLKTELENAIVDAQGAWATVGDA